MIIQSPLAGSGAAIDVNLVTNGGEVTVQNPLPSDGDSVYVKDVDTELTQCAGWVGDILTLFQETTSTPIVNSTADNPKTICVYFHRTISALQVALGANTGNFSNVKLVLLGSAGVERTLVDMSGDDTKIQSLNLRFGNELFNSIRVEFHTDDPVSLSNLYIIKTSNTIAQIEGRTPGNDIVPVKVSQLGELFVALGRDIFGNLSVAEQFSLWDSTRIFPQFISLFWTNLLVLGGTNTHDKVTSSSVLSVPAVSGAISATQLKSRIKYQPLKAHKGAYTGVFAPQAGVEKYFGLGDLDNYGNPTVDGTIYNGAVFCVKDGDCYLQIYNNGVKVSDMARADWNIDKLDGNGPSRFLLNLNYAQIGLSEMEWLGVGAVKMYFNIDGENIPVHLFRHANVSVANVYMRTANLSPFYMVKSVGGAGSMKAICNAVISGGGHNPVGIPRVIKTPTAQTINSGIEEALVFVRLSADSYEATVNVKEFGGIVTTSSNAYYSVIMNPAITSGPALVWQQLPNSHIEYAFGDDHVVTQNTGIVLGVAPVSTDGDAVGKVIDSRLRLGKELQSNATNQADRYDVIALTVLSLSTNESYLGYISIEDIV
jgi:hypothetical protein